jgi:hypothetical protein
VAGALGNDELAVIAIRRAWDAAERLERPDPVGLTAMSRAIALNRIGLADRIAPIRIRQDPIARELVVGLDRRAKRRAWEQSSLKNRLGVA